MNFKFILLICLVVVILLGLVTFGYLTYAIYGTAATKIGSVVFTDNQLMFYVNLATHLLALGLAGGVTYMG